MHNYLHCQYLCSYLAARYLLQLYCSLATSYCGSFGVLHYFDYICGLRYDIPQHGVNMLASTTSLVFLLQCDYLSALLRQCSICCNIFYSIWRTFYARRLCFLLGSTLFVYASWCFRQHFLMAIFYWLSCLVFFSAFVLCSKEQTTANHSLA